MGDEGCRRSGDACPCLEAAVGTEDDRHLPDDQWQQRKNVLALMVSEHCIARPVAGCARDPGAPFALGMYRMVDTVMEHVRMFVARLPMIDGRHSNKQWAMGMLRLRRCVRKGA